MPIIAHPWLADAPAKPDRRRAAVIGVLNYQDVASL